MRRAGPRRACPAVPFCPLIGHNARWRAFFALPVKGRGAIEGPLDKGASAARKTVAAQGWEWSERRRLIRLLYKGHSD